ncbi:M20/M25/M40 family metallo-hydrolase [Actinospongicola halichondriae]|uniref:M20/M25/M40 family metallo-hydrolase n=1 Tax=Actinospongicola halichondriae TaxID=3236844 RepID=UPI003D43DE6E
MTLDPHSVRSAVDARWSSDVVDTLCDFIRIPNVSPAFDRLWAANGHMGRAGDLVRDWCAAREIDGLTVEVRELDGRTPLVLCEIPASEPSLAGDTVLLYGHLDKQPEMSGWRDGLGPWTPVLDGDLLYGRGGADDGYAAFAALTAIEALQESGGSHGRLLLLIEASEESGSPDLPAHLEALGDRLGDVSLVVGLDSGAASYDRLWVTTSLRGVVSATLRVDVLTEGVHSGSAGGVVPSSFRILRQLMDRIEDSTTGRVLVDELWVDVPDERLRQIDEIADEIAGDMAFPFAGSTVADHRRPIDAVRARTWEPSIATIAVDGFPPPDRAGNVLRPHTAVSLAIRLPPTADPSAATDALRRRFTDDPPNGAVVTVEVEAAEAGWNAPDTEPWLQAAVDRSSESLWGRPSSAMGEGGTIPFMGMLGEQFPDAQFLITGVLGPGSNAHGPNEFLHLPMARSIAATVSHVLDAHARR